MPLTKRVRAGVLLYALLISAIFALVLNLYLGAVLANHQQNQALSQTSQAYLMADLAKSQEEETGQLNFEQGQVTYQTKGDKRQVTVSLDGRTYQFEFLQKPKDKKQE